MKIETLGYVYKKVCIPSGNGDTYTEIYQALNGERKNQWYKDLNGDGLKETSANIEATSYGLTTTPISYDYSAINYYVQAKAFSMWVEDDLNDIQPKHKLSDDGVTFDPEFQENIANYKTKIFDLENDPENENSNFARHKSQIIRKKIRENLNQAIINYGAQNPEVFDFKTPELTESQWQQIEKNVSIAAFLQGVPIGTKYYNNYAIATSTKNKDFVNTDEIYFGLSPGVNKDDPYYHQKYCENIVADEGEVIGYRSSDYVVRRTNVEDPINQKHYFLHTTSLNTNAGLECYYCLVNRSAYEPSFDPSYHPDYEPSDRMQKIYNTPYYEAIGRERYIQSQVKVLE